ncbi:MAG TPA: endonuclease III [Acidimicrobiales bacterium]|nr:endonuclease III [Acidimicrobiales bacterium]
MAKPRTPKGRARLTNERLKEAYPDALCALVHDNPFQLLVATILSAQSTDEMVNKVTPGLFAVYPDAESMAAASPADIEPLVQNLGLFRNKAKSLAGMAAALVERHNGEVPTTHEELTALPGVGRKTANVVRSVAFRLPGLPVDTHVGRISRLLGLTEETDPVKVEHALGAMLPPGDWGDFSLRMILHGRAICIANRPRCEICPLNDFCPSAFRAFRSKP